MDNLHGRGITITPVNGGYVIEWLEVIVVEMPKPHKDPEDPKPYSNAEIGLGKQPTSPEKLARSRIAVREKLDDALAFVGKLLTDKKVCLKLEDDAATGAVTMDAPPSLIPAQSTKPYAKV